KLLEFRFGVVEIRPVVARPELGPFLRIEDVEQASVPERLALEPDVRGLVKINLDAPVLESAVGLRRPRIARLAITGGRLPENAAQVVITRAFATRELLDAASPVERGLVFGHGGVL